MCIWKAVADYRWSIYLLLVLESRWRSSVAGGGVGDHVHGSFHPFFRSSHRTKLYIAKKGSDFDEPRYQVKKARIDRWIDQSKAKTPISSARLWMNQTSTSTRKKHPIWSDPSRWWERGMKKRMGERWRLSERGMASLLPVERERNGRADGVRTGGLWAAAGARWGGSGNGRPVFRDSNRAARRLADDACEAWSAVQMPSGSPLPFA